MFQTLCICCLLLTPGQDETREGEREWEGIMDLGSGQKATFRIMSWNENGEAKASFQRLNPDGAVIPFSSFEAVGNDIVMKVKEGEQESEFRATVNQDRTEAKGVWRQGDREFPMTMRPVKLIEVWVGEFKTPAGPMLFQFRILETGEDRRVVKFDSLSEGATGFPATLERQNDDPKIAFTIPLLKARFEGTLNGTADKATGVWIQNGRSNPIVLQRQDEEAKPPEPPKPPPRPQTPTEPFRYDIQEVTFENKEDNVTLAGTLTLPSTEGKHPAVVLISGSGPQDRDETIVYHKPFLLIADTLTKAGFGVLRFDDRGFGASTGNHATATTADFANDVRAAVEFLRAHEKIDTRNIGLIGHSEGGLIAPMVAAEDNEIGFIVLLAGPGVNGFEILKDQGRRLAFAEGATPEEVKQESELRDTVAAAVRNAFPNEDMGAVVENAINLYVARQPPDLQAERRPTPDQVEAFKQLGTPWFRFFLSHEPAPVLQKVKCPVLAVNGERDLQVWHETNLPAVAKALRSGGNDKFRAVRIPGLNHLFQRAPTGAASEYAEIKQTMAPAVLDLMTNFLKKNVTAAAK